MHRVFSRILSLGLLVGLVLAALPPPSAFAIGSSVVVNTNLDEVTNNSTCSLREALQALYVPLNDDCGNLSSPLVITFAPGVGTIRLTQGDVLPNIGSNKIVTVTGPVIIDGRETGKPDYGSFVLFDVKSGGILNVANLTFTKAFRAINADSGAVINIAGVSFLDNKSTYGAAIYATGADTKVNIAGSLFTTNTATDAGSSGGGAIYTGGISNLNIGGTIFTGNTSKLSGGAISTGAKNVNITDVIFNVNIANADDGDDDAYDYGGGAIFYSTPISDPKMTITRSIFNGNISTKGSGGAIMINSDSDVAEIRSSSFNGNLAGIPGDETAGGAIYNRGKLTIAQSTILNNAVVGSGGGIANDRRAELTLVNSSVIANAATSEGGGLFNKTTQQGSSLFPYAKVLNTTFALNVAGPSGG
jgi:CSLREA domain-containing protein